jgi:GT2 family glycosyltransferase
MPNEPVTASILLVVPAFGATHLTDSVLADLLRDDLSLVPNLRIVVVDNKGDYRLRASGGRVSVHTPAGNIRWIGATNWGLSAALDGGDDIFVVLNNDTRLSRDFVYWLVLSLVENEGVALAASCYDDFWLHQRVWVPQGDALEFEPRRAYRSVPFCDGTALAFRTDHVRKLGILDSAAFPRHGYGADVDFALRARAAGLRCLVTESAYLSHLRRGTMDQLPGESSKVAITEIVTGLDALWGDSWRATAGLTELAFEPNNTGCTPAWYLGRAG